MKLLTRVETAEVLRTTPKTLANQAARSEGPPYVIVAGRALYDEDAVLRWLAQQPRGGDVVDRGPPANANAPRARTRSADGQ